MDTKNVWDEVDDFINAQKAINKYISVDRYPDRYVVMYYIADKKATKVFYITDKNY